MDPDDRKKLELERVEPLPGQASFLEPAKRPRRAKPKGEERKS
jgi:hypothetical protein